MGAAAGGGRAARALRLLLLSVLGLAAVEYLFGSILDASPIKTYLYMPLYNATQPSKIVLITKRPNISSNTSELINNPVNETKNAKNMTILSNDTHEEMPTVASTTNTSRPTSSEDISLLITKIAEGVRSSGNSEIEEMKRNFTEMPQCDNNLSDLGPIPVNKSKMNLSKVEEKYAEVQLGGLYTPPNCTARHRVAIIVPYRDREEHLAIFLNHMHPFLMKQQIEYGIFIVEQKGKNAFNRAKLMNVGFKESQNLKEGKGWQCFIFHDIDLLPLDLRNFYSCPRQPRHMSAAIDIYHYKLPYDEIFGGVSAMTLEQFEKVNGFSNKYWGWGGEDDDMFYRLNALKYHISRYKMSVARYTMLTHKKSTANPKRYQLLSQTSKTFHKDGLSNLKYEVDKITKHHLYTHILVNIDETS